MNWLFLIYIFILFVIFAPNIWITSKIDKNILYLLHGFVFTFLLYFGRYMFDIKESMINNKTFDITVNNHPNMNVHRDKYIQYYREYYKQIQEKQNKKYAENIKKAEEEIQQLDVMIQQQIRESEVKKGEINKQFDNYKAYQEGKLNELKAAQAKNLELQKKNEQDIKDKFDAEYKKLMEEKAFVEINYNKDSRDLQTTIANLNEQIKTNTDSYQQQVLQQNIEVASQKLILSEQLATNKANQIEKEAEITRQKAIVERNKIKYDGDILTLNNNNKRIIEEKNSNIATLNATNLQLDTDLNLKITELSNESKKLDTVKRDLESLRSEYNSTISSIISEMEGLDSNIPGDLEKINKLAADLDGYISGLATNRSEKAMLDEKYSKLTTANTQTELDKSTIEKELSNLKNKYNTNIGNVDELTSQYTELKREKDDLFTNYTTLQNAKAKLQTEFDKLNSNDYKTSKEYNELNTQLETKNKELSDKNKDILDKNKEITELSAKLSNIKPEISDWDTSTVTYIKSINDKMVAPKNNYIKDINAYNNDVKKSLETTINELKLCSTNPKGTLPRLKGRKNTNAIYMDAYAEAAWHGSDSSDNTNVLYYRWMNTGYDAVYVYMFADDYVKLYVNNNTFRGSSGTNHTYSSPGAYTPHKIDTGMGLKKYGCNTFKFAIRDDRKSEHFTAAVYSKMHDASTNGSMKQYALFATGPYWNRGWFYIPAALRGMKGNDYTLPASAEPADSRATSDTSPELNALSSIYGAPLTKANCLARAKAQYGDKVTAKRAYLISGNWGHLPQGCTVQSSGDWAAHWNDTDGRINNSYPKVVESQPPSLTDSKYVVDNNEIKTKKEYSMSKQKSVMSILNNVDSGNNSNVYKTQYDELYSQYNNKLDSHKDEISKLNSDHKESLDKSKESIRNLEIRNRCKPPTGSDNPSKHGKQITNRIYNDVGAEGIWDNVYGSDVANVLYYNWLNPGLDKVYVYMYCDDYVKLYVNGFNWIASSTYHGDAPSKANVVVPRSDGKGFLKNGCNVFKFLVRERDGDQHLTVAVYAQPHDSKKSAQENEQNLLFASGPKWNQDWYVFEEMRTTGEKNNEYRLSDGKARQPSWLQNWIDGLNS